ncbi:MAG: hypothetical protein V4651_06260 [Bacteroidota bacterium]
MKVLLLFIATIVVLVLGAFFYIPSYINKKITAAINDNTEFSLNIGQVSFTGYHSLELSAITLQHKLNRDDYIKSKGFQTDWISCKINAVIIDGINWKQLLSDKNIFSEKLRIHSPDIYIFRDKRVPSKYKYTALPAAMLREMKFPFSIPVTEIEHGKIIYEELAKENGEKIKVSFDHLFATIHHMSSDPLYLLTQPILSIEAKASILDSVKTVIRYSANTLNPDNVFSFEGHTQSFSAKLLNKCITPATNVIIDDGFVNSIHFKFIAHENEANGTINMDYKDLKLKVLKKITNEDEADTKFHKKHRFNSFITNLFVRNEDKKDPNPAIKHIPRNTPMVNNHTGKIHFVRRKDRFIFNYWWNSFKSGITATVLEVPAEKLKK